MSPAPKKAHEAVEVVSAYSKLAIDWMKHLMTLSVGIIVLAATFRDHIEKNAMVVGVLPLAVASLLAGILCAMKVCFDLLYYEGFMANVRAWHLTGQVTAEQVEAYKGL